MNHYFTNLLIFPCNTIFSGWYAVRWTTHSVKRDRFFFWGIRSVLGCYQVQAQILAGSKPCNCYSSRICHSRYCYSTWMAHVWVLSSLELPSSFCEGARLTTFRRSSAMCGNPSTSTVKNHWNCNPVILYFNINDFSYLTLSIQYLPPYMPSDDTCLTQLCF